MDMVLDTAVKYNDIFLSGVKITIIISLLSCFFGLLLGIILAFMKISGIKVLQWISTAYVEVIRGTPVLVQISLVFFGLPFLGIHFPSFQSVTSRITTSTAVISPASRSWASTLRDCPPVSLH